MLGHRFPFKTSAESLQDQKKLSRELPAVLTGAFNSEASFHAKCFRYDDFRVWDECARFASGRIENLDDLPGAR
jgi:hypothetical protein